MTTDTHTIRAVRTSVPIKHTCTVVTIDMPDDDAIVLHSLLRLIGGAPAGPRGVLDRISTALDKAGVTYNERLRLTAGQFTRI